MINKLKIYWLTVCFKPFKKCKFKEDEEINIFIDIC